MSVTYQLPQTLLVTVHKAVDLPPREDGKPANSFCKVHVPGTKTYFQTNTIDYSLNPVWEETFEFEVAQEEFNQR